MIILKVNNVTVRYQSDAFKNMRWEKRLMSWITGKGRARTFYALNKVSFKLEDGEVLGIIGKNGSGKSTLLKTIAGTITPVRGSVKCRKRISALLELGTGFDRELTVRENIYLRAALLGYSREFLEAKYKDIIEFSELKDFENSLYQNLSSGMRSRMAFSIVSIMEPEILVLDEVFSVGDGAFREKSRLKMMELMEAGVSTILVSHTLSQIRKLCTRVIWLDKGRLIMDGDTKTVCDAYNNYLDTGVLPDVQVPPPEKRAKSAPGSKSSGGKKQEIRKEGKRPE